MKPCLVSSRSWMISGRSRLRAYEKVVNQKPGISSSVMAAPPTFPRRSRTSVLRPAFARYAPLTISLCPAPMTIASWVRAVGFAADFDAAADFEAAALRSAFFAFLSVGMSGSLPCGVVERQAGGARGDVFVAVVHIELELDMRPGRGEVRPDAGERDVALQHRRIHQARRIADLAPSVVIDEVLLVDRRVVLRRDEPGPVVGPGVVVPVDEEAGQPPARGRLGDLSFDRASADEWSVVVGQTVQHPRPAELDRGRPVLVRPAEPARREIDVEQEQPGLDPKHVQRGESERQDAEPIER